MDIDKLNKAAIQNKHRQFWTKHTHKTSFENGAQWLMQQPLADRLTDEEKEKIKAIYWQAMKDWVSIGEARGYCKVGIAIESIFGKELFNEK